MKNQTQQIKSFSLTAAVTASMLCLLFGANSVAIKISLTGLGPFTTAGVRFSFAAVVISLWAFFTHRPFKINKNQFGRLIIVGMIFTVQLSLIHLGLSKTAASRGALLTNLQPFFVLILAHFFLKDDVITFRKTIGILMGFTGVFFCVLRKTRPGYRYANWGLYHYSGCVDVGVQYSLCEKNH